MALLAAVCGISSITVTSCLKHMDDYKPSTEVGEMTKRLITMIGVALAIIVPGTSTANSELMKLMDNPNNWAIWGGNYAGQRYSKLNQINSKNVGDLQVAWTFSTGVLRGHEGGPLVVGDTLYIHTPFPNKVFAIDLNDQTIIWRYEPKQNPDTIPVMCCDTVARGLAYADGKIFLQQADTHLVALNAKTGKMIWRIKNASGTRTTERPRATSRSSSGRVCTRCIRSRRR